LIEVNKLIFEIKNENGILKANWSSDFNTPISLDILSDYRINEYIQEYNGNLTINCKSSNGIRM
jgi:hypothetical protein